MKQLKLIVITCFITLILTACNVTISSNHTTTKPEYTEYLDWNGYYTGGWMENGLLLELHPDYDFATKCGTVENDFRGNRFFGRVYYMGNSEFTFQIFSADGSYKNYLVRPKMNNDKYELDIYDQDGDYDCTFTKDMTLEEYAEDNDWLIVK